MKDNNAIKIYMSWWMIRIYAYVTCKTHYSGHRRFLAFCVKTGCVYCGSLASKTPMLPFLRTVADDTVFWAGCANQFCMRWQEVVRAAPAPLFQGWRLRRAARRPVHPRRVRLILCKSAISNSARHRPRLILFTEIWKLRAPIHPLVCLQRFFSLENPFRNLPQKQPYRGRMQSQEVGRWRVCMGKCCVFWLRGQNVNTPMGVVSHSHWSPSRALSAAACCFTS